MRRRPAVAVSLFAIAMLAIVAFGVSAGGTAGPEAATEVPTSIPVNGVNINTQVVLMPKAPGDAPVLDESQAVDKASGRGASTLIPPTAILARVTVPGTIPPPDSPVPFRTIEDRLAWVVTFTSDKPEEVGTKKPSRDGSASPPLLVTHYSAVLDADTGEFLIGFYTA
jgi:hypothetical protein